MKLTLSVKAGPHQGKVFPFDTHDSFLVGRCSDADLRLQDDDPYFSRRHFVIEVNPPRCRLMDLKSRNGTYVNGKKVAGIELHHNDEIKAGHTVFTVSLDQQVAEHATTMLPAMKMLGPGDQLPPVIAGYELLRELGRGGMGVVHLARRLHDDQHVALKTIIPGKGTSTKEVDMFLREARILAKLKHPQIVGFESIGTDSGVVYLEMQLVSGPDLAQLLRQNGKLKISAAVRVARQMLAGLQYAHDCGVVHRDIKPGNLLLDEHLGTRTIRIADFGLAKVYDLSQLSGLTLQGEVGGTVAYIAPEQILHFRNTPPSADQYSAAGTLYTLLTDETPHELTASAVHDKLIQVCTSDPVSIRERRPEIPQGLADVIHQALQREPANRFLDAAAFRRALKPWSDLDL